MPRHFANVETYAFAEKRVFADGGQITVDAFLEHTLGTRRLGPIGSVVRVVEIGETVVRIMPVSNEEVVVQVKRNVSLATAFGAQGGDDRNCFGAVWTEVRVKIRRVRRSSRTWICTALGARSRFRATMTLAMEEPPMPWPVGLVAVTEVRGEMPAREK